jgi:hypothetical protein
VALSLMLCEQVIVDHQTRNPSLIGIFTGRVVDSFPSEPQRFSVFASLTNGHADGVVKLVATRLDTGEVIYEVQHPIHFPDPLTVINANIRIRAIRFPVPGLYEFILSVDSDPIAQRTLRVYKA